MFLPAPNGGGANLYGERAMLAGVYPFFLDPDEDGEVVNNLISDVIVSPVSSPI